MNLTESDYRILLTEKAPPGLDPVVKALKSKPSIDNPYAVAWSMYNENGLLCCMNCGKEMGEADFIADNKCSKCEAFSMSSASALLRGRKHESVRESHRHLYEAVGAVNMPDPKGDGLEGHVVKVVLLSEGLGNMRDKNYYGQEAVRSMPAAFEGAPCMVDHPSSSEEQDIPEGRVNKTVGYYKNLRVETVASAEGSRLACSGELHFDSSPEGLAAFEKAKTAVHYSHEFPGIDREYVGLSVNAFGESETRIMTVGGEDMEVNYVTRFVEVRSCDIVTIPARGGKIVALVESVAGARHKNKEVRNMIANSLEKAQKALKEAMSEKDASLREKKISEAQKVLSDMAKTLVKEGVAKSKEAEGEAEGKEADAEMESDDMATESEDGSDDAGDDDAGSGDSHTTVTHKVVKKTGKAAMGESQREANKLAIKALVTESGLSDEFFDIAELEAMPFHEAKREIARTKRVSEATGKAFVKKYGDDVAAGHFAKTQESGGEKSKASNNADFADLSV